MTAIIAIAHAMRINKDFRPHGLYLATFVIDITIIESLLR